MVRDVFVTWRAQTRGMAAGARAAGPPPAGGRPPGPPRAVRDARTNLALGALLVSAVGTGLVANTAGTGWGRWLVVGHGAAGLALVLLSRRKSRIARRSLGRPRRRPGSASSLWLAGLVVLTLVSGLVASSGLVRHVGPLTIMQVHIGAAVLAIPLALDHFRRRTFKVRTAGVDRRTVLRAGLVGAAAGAAWLGWEGVLRATDAPGARRRFTGSHERGSGDPAAMPVTQWLDDTVLRLDPAGWRLRAGGTELTLAQLRALPADTVTAVLDCTSEWWSEQQWRGVRLDRLLDPGTARSVEVRSATGYALRLPVRDLDSLWLAYEVGGRPLSAGHGAPARLVAPGRRGFWWVKWVTSVQPSDVPWWVQSPFPVT